jgi:hypothetical protein
VTRLLTNPLFWMLTIILAWLIVITMSIASDPEGARAQSLPPQPAVTAVALPVS